MFQGFVFYGLLYYIMPIDWHHLSRLSKSHNMMWQSHKAKLYYIWFKDWITIYANPKTVIVPSMACRFIKKINYKRCIFFRGLIPLDDDIIYESLRKDVYISSMKLLALGVPYNRLLIDIGTVLEAINDNEHNIGLLLQHFAPRGRDSDTLNSICINWLPNMERKDVIQIRKLLLKYNCFPKFADMIRDYLHG
jgi:hypothetical protein